MAKRAIEPFLWMAFSAGGVLSALLIPVILALFGVAFPLGWLTAPEHGRLLALVEQPLTRAMLLLLAVLSLVHWAHRFRYTLYDGLRIKHLNELINLLCYGGAALGSVVAGYVFLAML